VPALERLRGIRIVADPAAIDGARWSGEDVLVLRFAPDEAFGIGASAIDLDDPDAIMESEAAFVGVSVPLDAFAHRLEWALPAVRPAFAQGALAGVPVKIWLVDASGTAFLVAYAASAPELIDRLGWDR
jgi:hypothetical protein